MFIVESAIVNVWQVSHAHSSLIRKYQTHGLRHWASFGPVQIGWHLAHCLYSIRSCRTHLNTPTIYMARAWLDWHYVLVTGKKVLNNNRHWWSLKVEKKKSRVWSTTDPIAVEASWWNEWPNATYHNHTSLSPSSHPKSVIIKLAEIGTSNPSLAQVP